MKNGFRRKIKNIFILLGFFSAFAAGFTSCVSYKTVTYFQADSTNLQQGAQVRKYTPVIQQGDLLSVVVGSLNNEANEIFNLRNMATAASMNYGASGAGAKLQPVGYLVDQEGDIEIPLIGKVKIAGITTEAAAENIRTLLNKYLKEPTVAIRNVNFKISVLGEVRSPATFVIPDETISLPQALSLAGDLTIYGKRQNVMVIREENGVRTYGTVDLTSRTLFESPYYYLHKNDVIYVEPTKSKVTSSDRTLQILPLVLSGISVIAVVLTRLF